MSRRVLLTSALIALLLGIVILAPGFPPVRTALLDRALKFAEEAGITVTYDRADGNAWRRIELLDVSVEGFGADVAVDRLELRYHLPSVLGGELPLSVAARGVDGSVDLSDLERTLRDAAADSGGAGVPLRVVLREVELQDVVLSSANAPFVVPDATISELSVVPEPGALLLGAQVTTDHGSVTAEGRLSLPSFDLTGTITHGDVAVAQYWWPGATSGTVSGPFSLRRGQLNADLTIADAQIDQSGFTVTDIGGTATMRYPVVTASLAGQALGGPVTAEGTVNITGMNYRGTGTATPQLSAAAGWLAEFLGLEGTALDATGQANVTAVVDGWKEPAIRGTASASGSLAGLPLDALTASLAMEVNGPLQADLDAQLAGGTVNASIAPSALGSRLELVGTNLDLQGLNVAGFSPGGAVEELRAQVELAGSPAGTATARWVGELADYSAAVDLDGRLDADGLQAFFVATATPGEGSAATREISATGAVVYAEQNVDAGVTVADLEVPGLDRPLRLGLTAQGTLDDLRLAATVENEQPVLLDVAVLQTGGALTNSDQVDARGRATGRLADGSVSDISGQFGPVSLSGRVDLSPLTAELDLSVAPLTVRVGSSSAAALSEPEDPALANDSNANDLNGSAIPEAPADAADAADASEVRPTPVQATVADTVGVLTYSEGALDITARSTIEAARAGTVRLDLETVDTRFQLRTSAGTSTTAADDPEHPLQLAGTAWSFEAAAPDGRARFAIDSSGAPYRVTLDDLPVYLTATGEPALTSGSLALADDGTLDLAVQIAPQSNLAGLTLVNGAELVGAILPAERRLELEGSVGELAVDGAVDWSQPLVEVNAVIDTAGAAQEALEVHYVPATEEWRLAGRSPLAPLLAELGLTGVEAEYDGQVAYGVVDGFTGAAQVQLAAPVPATLQLTGTGDQLDLLLTGEVGGVPVEGEGAITEPLIQALVGAFGADGTDAPSLLVDMGPLQDLTVDAAGVRGAGEIPAAGFGPAVVGPVPWSLEFRWSDTAGFVEAGGEVLNVALQGGLIHASGSVAAPLTYAGQEYQLSAWPGESAGSAVAESQIDHLVVGGSLTPAAGGAAIASVSGTLDQLNVALTVPLEELTAALPANYQPRGRLTAAGTVDLLDGPTYEGQLTLSPSADSVILGTALPGAATDELQATFSGVAGAFELNVDGAGLQLDRTPPTGTADGRLTLVADAVDLSRFLPEGLTGVVDGTLSYNAAGWRGELEAQVRAGDPTLDATVKLVGAFSTLNLEVTGNAVGATTFSASGPLLPQPDVTGRFEVQAARVAGEFSWTDDVNATVRSAEQIFAQFVTLPALAADLNVDMGTGLVTLRSPTGHARRADIDADIDLALQGSEISGNLVLPLQVNGVDLTFAAAAGGTLADPSLEAVITSGIALPGPAADTGADAGDSGPGVLAPSSLGTPIAELSGSLRTGATLNATVPRATLLDFLPATAAASVGLLGENIDATASIEPSGDWTARLGTHVAPDLTASGNPLELEIIAAGALTPTLEYQGELRLLADAGATEPDLVARAPFTGSGAAVNARLDLATVAWAPLGTAFGVDLDIQGGGELAVATRPLSASLTVDLVGNFSDNAVSLRGTAPDDLRLTLDGPAGHLGGNLAWARSVTGGGTAVLTGELAGRPVELQLNVDDGLTSGDLTLQAVGAELTARLTTQEPVVGVEADTTRLISVSADVPVGTWAEFGGSLTADVTIQGNDATVDSLVASIDGLLGEADEPLNRLNVVAAGTLTSGLHVTGVVTSPRLQENLNLEVTDEPGVQARLSWRNLTATASMQDGGTVSLTGSAADTDVMSLLRAAGGTISPALLDDVANLDPSISQADLTWSAATGWGGNLRGAAELPWVPALGGVELMAEAEGGSLRLVADTADPDGVARLNLLVPGSAWATSPLSGALEIDLPSSTLLPGLNVPLQLRSAALIEGTVTSPTLSGSLLLTGALTAQGTYGYADGAGFLTATGPELTITGRLDADGAVADAQVTELEVGEWVPQLPNARLSLAARFSGSQVSVDNIALIAPSSTLTGRGTVGIGGNGGQGAQFSAALDTDVDLTDLDLGDVQLTGTVHGPLVISSGSLQNLAASTVVANLAALNVGTAGLGWSVSGNLTVGGTLADPTVAAQVTGDGELRGVLSVSAKPTAREYAITSSLSTQQMATDLRIDIGNGSTSAAGTVRVGDGLFLVSESATPGASEAGQASEEAPSGTTDLVITGAGRFAGIGAQLRGDLSAVTVTGDLSSLGSALEGQLSLTADARAESWLYGQITQLSVSGYELAPLTIQAVTMGAPVLMESSDLRATLDPATMDWTIGVNDYRLGNGAAAAEITVWGRGRGAIGTLDASLTTADVNASLEVRHDTDTSVLLEGRVYGGELLVTGSRTATSGEWSGAGRLDGAHLAGFDITAQATMLGVGLIPTLVLTTRAQNGLAITGNASIGTDGVALDQFIAGSPLDQMVRVQGRVLPRTDLTLSTLDVAQGTTVSVAEATRATTSSVHLASLPGVGADAAASLRATGNFSLPIGPARVELAGAGSPPSLAVSLAGLPRWRAEGQLLAEDAFGLVQSIATSGLSLEGQDDAKGHLHLDLPGMNLELDGFGLEFAGINAEASGTLGLNHADMTGQVLVRTDLPVAERQTGYVFPWTLTTEGGIWRLSSDGQHGSLDVVYGAEEGAGALSVSADLSLSDGRIEGQLGLQPGGLAGILSVSSIRLLSPEFGTLSIDAEATVADGRIGGSSTLDSAAGQVVLSGAWGLGGILPAAVAPDAPTGGRLEARVRALELSEIPVLAEQVPELRGQITGTAQLRDGFLLGQLVAQEIGVADLSTPLHLAFSGRPADLTLDLQLRGAIGRANLANGNLSGMFRFERFPLNLVSTAVVGPADFSADLTGVMRFDGPLAAPLNGYLRLATEEVRLERMGVTTLGNVTVTYDQEALLVEKAEFAGLGNWRAFGELRRDNFDFHLEAEQADFTPLLGLVPQFARLGVGAVGSFDLSVLGNASNPNIELASPDLEVEVSGTSYRLRQTLLELEGVNLSVTSRVEGLKPITGTVDVEGHALLSLFPFTLGGTELNLTGAADLSTFGRLTDIEGQLQQLPDGTPTVHVMGIMGERPLTIEGTLAPLELSATGTGVTVRLPNLLVDHAVVNADVQLVTEPGGVVVSGSVVAEEVIVDPAARRPAAAPEPAEDSVAQPEVEAIPSIEAPPASSAPAPRTGGLAALRFGALSIRAPGRVTLTTNVGSFEAGLDIVLSGTGAEPRLSGTASAIRGNLRFGGRDFTIDRAVATFTPNRGVYPELDVAAHAEFDKQRVVSAAPNVSFVAPREGSTFEVQLAFFGPVEPTGDGGFRFDIQPILGSNAVIEVDSQGTVGSATRPFTEAELMALVTLGRFELNADLIGSGGLGEAVATGALDTAIDLLVVSGLESALREALGFDVVEIRTTSLASLLDAGGQPFGVSLRVGGYLHPELFASYRIGTYDGTDPEFSITNEVLLRYGLGPLDLDVIGRIDIPTPGAVGQPRPEVGVVLGYQFSPWLGIDGGVSVSPVRSRLEFGVTIRW